MDNRKERQSRSVLGSVFWSFTELGLHHSPDLAHDLSATPTNSCVAPPHLTPPVAQVQNRLHDNDIYYYPGTTQPVRVTDHGLYSLPGPITRSSAVNYQASIWKTLLSVYLDY